MVEIAHDAQCVAFRQLETALRLYFEGEDYYSVTTLASASEGVFGKLLGERENALASHKKAASEIHKRIYGEELPKRKEAGYHPNDVVNFLKHGPSSGEQRIMEFDAKEEAKGTLCRAIDNYYALTTDLSPAMSRFNEGLAMNNAQIRGNPPKAT